jgi:sugar transferase (PEP-CTERM/EpsH1 system associated)
MTAVKKIPLLFLCHRIPYPPNKGDKIRSFHLMHHLSQHFDIYLATFVDDPQDWPWVPEVEKFCVDSLFLKLRPATARLRSLSGLLTGKVLSLPYYQNAQMQAWVKARVAERGISHLLVFSAAMAQYVLDPALAFRYKVIDFVDVDSDKWLQYSLQKRWPMSWVYRREGKLLLDFEREVARVFDAGLFVSASEAAMFRNLAPESAHKLGYYNNGVNLAYFMPDDSLPEPYAAGERALVFTGAMDYWPNIDAVTWFAREIFPRMRMRDPSLNFYIVGSSPTGAVTQLANLPGVTVTGRVEDVRPYLQYALAAVAPMRIARGVQNKVLEAMAMEKPVIVSSKGLEGIDADHGQQVLVADTVAQYCTCLEQIESEKFPRLGQQARELISHRFDWDNNLPEVVYLLGGDATPQTGAKASAGNT